ncbi:unnamed protein product [Spirodela intermedia]|uniref:C3H1-type domain-containing protein n=1 Tax=Spirodela intermedia TaxID=51605 RepID=A0A7I8J8T1_SPIIN|nr:unnamed protein product [Spirodela intermedia]CAA6666638.1 unnamed protein product [Spirodela intermedia]
MEFDGRDSSHPPISAEEEAVKRNTDCVYFLASPLTCKKGNECEYRHSEGARVNPRDCWYWLSGSCLNPKCLFRHPFDSPRTCSVCRTEEHSSRTGSCSPSASSFFNQQSVPCYYFQNGGCLKGSRCPFTHGGSLLLALRSKQDSLPCLLQNRCMHPRTCPGRHRGLRSRLNQKQLPTRDWTCLARRKRSIARQKSHLLMGLLLRVLGLPSTDWFEGEAYDGVAEFERYGQHNEYRQENKRSSERRGPMREDSHGKLDASDLRHRLLKQRKANRPRSAIIAAHRDEPHQESDGDISVIFPESSISKRLQGRIKLPERPDLDNYSSSRSERAADKGRSRGRSSSPGRPSSRQGRDHEITKQKAHKQDPGREEEAGPLNFAGPKSLAELKGMMTRNNGSAITQDRKISEADPSFERPKLPSAILKRKREEAPEAAMERPASRDRMTISSSGLENGDGLAEGPKSSPVEEEEENTKLPNGQLDEETNPKEEDLAEWPLSEHPLPERQMLETEDGDFQEEDHELDDEDGDDFARKLGVMLS